MEGGVCIVGCVHSGVCAWKGVCMEGGCAWRGVHEGVCAWCVFDVDM